MWYNLIDVSIRVTPAYNVYTYTYPLFMDDEK